ncbi:excinuclease ABC subunit UvrA [Nonlabens ponticola]|uniref:UvrABC system protein A n=1 Tax=Nonlabens ponticola TaxID=2496866 RepID=A0A3S9MZD6_9FLAO|nr:excinuclease ABC subunit UvrA [Nonlabens ponticola]AZQ44509.1 excinuclease ABC subunit UvrA [Nonlabens ponticola]
MATNQLFDNIDSLSPKENILIKGAQLHNLKNLNAVIPRNELVVITGLSGSGKSSLAFDTLYAEGQRRYVESLSSYARQFLGRLNKPKVEYIKGIAPAIAIEQKVNSTNPRSTVGTTTEVYDYLKLLFARIGRTISPISGDEVKKDTITDVVNYIKEQEEGTKLLLTTRLLIKGKRDVKEQLAVLLQQGFTRIKVNDQVVRIDQDDLNVSKKDEVFIVIDRIIKRDDEDFFNRLADAIDTAFFEGKGVAYIEHMDGSKRREFTNKFELDGMEFLEPNPHLFSFNNPYGACPKCEGYGDVIGIDEDLVIPNTALSVYESAVFPWRGENMKWYKEQLIKNADKFNFPIHRPWFELTEQEKNLVWDGNKYFSGINDFFAELEAKAYKIQNRVMLSRYRGKTRCLQCKGKRLRKEANYVKINGTTITDLVEMPIKKLKPFFDELELNTTEEQIAKRLLKEIRSRLNFLSDVGLNYLTLNRKSNTLSGGESQRINLATSLGSSLVGSMYILDEPSIGLHPRDTARLIKVLKNLRDLGNTVIVVEHDEEIMQAADRIIDIGPEAGTHGGEVVAAGTLAEILESSSLTASYLNGSMEIPLPRKRNKHKYYIDIKGARENNLKNIDVRFPLGVLTMVTGVSGSGKSTLVKQILYPAIMKKLGGYGQKPGQFTDISGKYENLKTVEFIDQNPIGRSSRSNPVTYIKAYDDIRNLMSNQKLSHIRNYKPKHFSFNVDGGRCETCKGDGEVTIEMQFMADVTLVCETCNGKRFKKDILEVTFVDKNIDDILNLTIDDAMDFFTAQGEDKIARKIKPLKDVGLGYVTLGQSSSTLSGGEAQRIKLASFLVKGTTKDKTLFIFDEPTTGLHFHDINKLLDSFNALIEKGHSVIVIEHNMDLAKCADHIIDLGPNGGADGGYLVASGTPEEVAQVTESYTAPYIAEKLS